MEDDRKLSASAADASDEEGDGDQVPRSQGPLRKRMFTPPSPPKRFKSSYICFSIAMQDTVKAELGGSAKISDISKYMAEKWRALGEEDRAKWDEMARKDRERYEEEVALFPGQMPRPKQRPKKDPNAPKRPMSSFLAFSQKYRGTVRQNDPTVSQKDVSKRLSEMWKYCPEDEKKVFIEREVKAREIYKGKVLNLQITLIIYEGRGRPNLNIQPSLFLSFVHTLPHRFVHIHLYYLSSHSIVFTSHPSYMYIIPQSRWPNGRRNRPCSRRRRRWREGLRGRPKARGGSWKRQRKKERSREKSWVDNKSGMPRPKRRRNLAISPAWDSLLQPQPRRRPLPTILLLLQRLLLFRSPPRVILAILLPRFVMHILSNQEVRCWLPLAKLLHFLLRCRCRSILSRTKL